MLGSTPTREDLRNAIRARSLPGEALARRQRDPRALLDAGLVWQGQNRAAAHTAAVQIVREGVRLRHIGDTISVLIVAPSGIDRFVGISECNFVYQGRLIITSAENLNAPLSPTKENDALAIGGAMGWSDVTERDGFVRQINFVIAGQATDRPSRLGVVVINELILRF